MFLLKAFAEPRTGKSATTTPVRGRAIGPAPLPKAERQKIWDKAVAKAKGSSSSRTWSTRFAFNGTQISDDGKYQIGPFETTAGRRYELIKFNGRGGHSRVGIYDTLDAAKKNAK